MKPGSWIKGVRKKGNEEQEKGGGKRGEDKVEK